MAGGGTLPSKENPGHGCDFSEKGQGNVGKGQDIWKFGQKRTKC